MASSQQPAPRPPYPLPNPSFRDNYVTQQPRPSLLNPQSPHNPMYSSPSPQSYSPQFSQPPAAKRPRLEDTPFSPPNYPQTPVAHSASPVGGFPTNGAPLLNRPGSMAPPQRPNEKERGKEERFDDDILRMSGIDVEAEDQNLARHDFYPQTSYGNRSESFQYNSNSFTQPESSGYATQPDGNGAQQQPEMQQPTAEEREQRRDARADWEASRHTQYPLWDMFLYGGPLNEKIREKSLQERLLDPQAGVLVNTQRNGPPPRAQVNGFEGAVRIIDKGQAILDSGTKGERLRELMSIISLATKHRMTGIVNASARLAIERREHSRGKVPTEWDDIAVRPPASAEGAENAQSAEVSVGMKRTHSQAMSETTVFTGTDRIATSFQKAAQVDRGYDEARRSKRAKRKTGIATSETPGTPDVAAMEAAVAAEASQKITKKAQKEMAGRTAEKEQHRSANEAARMAVSMGSRFGGKKNKSYDWMHAGKSGTSTPITPSRFPSSGVGSVAGTPSADRTKVVGKERRVEAWNEEKDAGIQVRDILLVLEADGRAPKTYVQALEKMKE